MSDATQAVSFANGPDGKLTPIIAAPSESQRTGRRSFFDDDRSTYATSIRVDGATFFVNTLSDEGKQFKKDWAVSAADKLGVGIATLMQFMTGAAAMSPEQREKFDEARNELWTRVVQDALFQWTLPAPQTPERIARLQIDIKRLVAEFIMEFTQDGVTESEFFRSRGIGGLR